MLINNNEYFEILSDIKKQIREAQYRAVLDINREQIILFWNIGKAISANVKYGNKFVDNLAKDIKLAFPEAKGYSVRNLNYMKRFAEIITDERILQSVAAKLSWTHNTALLIKIKDQNIYKWYGEQTIENGWSVSVLEDRLQMKTYERQAISEKATNYERLLPDPQSKLATETLKSPFVFDFIEKRDGIIEREIENELIANIAKTLLELGTGFAFIGNQYHLEISNRDYYIDLLFYNTKLRCYVVIELKNTEFKPEYAGKLNFYLSAIDDILKHPQDNPTIGIMLCKTRDKLTAEYALKDINKPIGVSEYKLSDFVPAEFVDTLPSADDIEKRVKAQLDIDNMENSAYGM
ncbi:PDDEXK nuclease domain-containing protein [Bacteroides sp. UBA939]|uniref:PDDEXK nuclease domain-containing protein n=1 Tax=Bacteroides sp. UBA939 TaxID=1946092 RepID=UPI0025C0DD18|nr:PDDEXK nuclease domain-containing protein [Bacteroides sp. UBA939]